MRRPSQLLFACWLLIACGEANGGSPSGGNTTLPQADTGTGGASAGVAGVGQPGAGNSSAGGLADLGGNAATGGNSEPTLGGSPSGGGAGQLGGNAGAGGETRVSDPIDFAYWLLQLPTGAGTKPDQISSAKLLAGYSDAYFYKADDGGQMFMEPAQGITTSGSKRCRTELREQKLEGGGAAWPSAGTHSMTVEGKVVKLGGGSIAVGQLFNGTDSIPLCELLYTNSGKFSLLYEEAKGGGSFTDLKTAVDLNTRYVFSLALTDGQLSVSINGKQVYTHKPSASILDNQFYFKVGNYDQSTSAGTPTTTPHSIVEVYKVDLVHE